MNFSARSLLLLSLALLIAVPLAAVDVAPGEWQFVGPDAGPVHELIAAPSNPQVMYAVAQSILYRSVDGGATWTRVSEDVRFHVAVDAVNPSLVYAVVPLRIVRSVDGGATWQELDTPGWPVSQLVAHPRFPRTLFAVTDEGLFLSTNAARSWKRLGRGLPAQYQAYRLVIDPVAPRRLYLALTAAATGEPRLYKSLDGGTSWQRIDTGVLAGKQILALVPHARSSRIVYASTPEDIYKTADGGGSWRAVGHRAGVEGVTTALAVQADRPAVLFAGGTNGVYRSLDAGETWQWVLAGVHPSLFLVTPRGLFANFNAFDRPSGLFRSPDGAITWHFSSQGIRAMTVFDIQFGEPGTLWIQADNYLIFRSTDQGLTWSQVRPDPLTLFSIAAFAVDPADRSNVFVLYIDGATWRSVDGGQTWEHRGTAELQAVDLEVDPQTPSTLYAAGYGGIAKSTDGGDTWTPLPAEDAAFYSDLEIAPSSPSTLYATGNDGDFNTFFLRSQDGGATWTRLSLFNRDLKPPGLAVDPLVATTVYSTEDAHILKSTDAGETWSVVSETLDANSIHPIDTAPSGRIYAAVWDVGVFQLEEGSPAMLLLGDFFPWIFTAVAADPHDPCRVWAGAQATSLMRFTYTGTAECP